MNIISKIVLTFVLSVVAVLFWVIPDPIPLVGEVASTLAASASLLSTATALRSGN